MDYEQKLITRIEVTMQLLSEQLGFYKETINDLLDEYRREQERKEDQDKLTNEPDF